MSPNHEPSWWLRCQLVDLSTRYTAGTLPTCGHRVPRVGVALWDGTARCSACITGAQLSGDADRTCDRCGTVCPNVIHPAALEYDALVVTFGLCPACHRLEMGR